MKNNQIATLATALSIAVLAMTPALATAQTGGKPAAAAKSKVKAKAKSRSKAKVVAGTAAVAAAVALTPEALDAAERVQVGRFPCEHGTSVTLSADPKTPGYFNMQGHNFSYRMFPVTTSTGAVRLEDPKSGAVWLQLGNKSMLMNQKQGSRLADGCMSPEQVNLVQGVKNTSAVSPSEPVAAPAAAGQ